MANVMDLQRLLFLLEAPEYCMRSFREHGVNGQDLLHMEEADLEDSRFKFPKHVQRKVLRIATAWRTFQAMTNSPTEASVTLEQCLDYYRCGPSPELPLASPSGSSPVSPYVQTAFHSLNVNNTGSITFEEFLVGYTLLEEAVSIAWPKLEQQSAGRTGAAATAAGATGMAEAAAPEHPSACSPPAAPGSSRDRQVGADEAAVGASDGTHTGTGGGNLFSSLFTWLGA